MFGLNINGVNSTFAAANKDAILKMNKDYADALNPDYTLNKSFPVIITQPSIYNPNSDTSYVSYNPLKSNLITSGFYKDLNKDKSVQKTLSKYYYYKIIDKWLYNDLLPLLAFVDLSSGKTQLIKSLSNYNVEKLAKDSESDIDKKVEYMEKILITKDMVRHVLKKICNENNINWYDLNKYEKMIKKVFYNYLVDKLKYAVKSHGEQ